MSILPPEEYANVDQQVFNDKTTIVATNSEVAVLLQRYYQVRGQGSTHPNIKKTKDYVDKFKTLTNETFIENTRMMLMNNGLQQFEMALIQNLMPEDANEAMVLVPSLKDGRYNEDQLTQILEELKEKQQFQ